MDQREHWSWRPAANRNGRARGAAKPTSPPVLCLDQSAVLRDRLLKEIAALPSEDSANAGGFSSPPLSRQSAPSLCRPTALPPLWPQAIRSPSPAPPAAAGLGPQGERRVRGATLSNPSPIGAPRRQ